MMAARATRDEEIRRRDTIIMNMTETMKALNPPAPEGSSEARESPEGSGPVGRLGEVLDELDTERTRCEMAESTLREGMDEERQELYTLREPRKSPQTGEEEPERAEPRPAKVEAQEDAQRSWWRRYLGG